MARRLVLGGLALVLSTGLTGAPPAAAQQPPAPTPAGPSTAPPPQDLGTIRLPEVSDPMLEPLSAAPNRLRTWRQALRMLRAQATAVRIAKARVAQARGQARQALAGALPQLTGTSAINRHLLLGTGVTFSTTQGFEQGTVPDPATTMTAGLQLRQPLLAPATWHRIKTANLTADALELTAKDFEREQLAIVAATAVNVVTAERVAEVSRVSLRSALSTLELTRRRAQLGAASALDVLRAEQLVSQSRAQVVSADESARQARESLGVALGDDAAWGVAADISLAELADAARASCQPVPDLQSRADIRAAAARVEIAERQEKTVDYRYAPTLDLTSNLDYTANADRSPNGKHVVWTVGAVLTWPLFDGGERVGDRARAEAETQIAREELSDEKRNAQIEVTQATRAVRVAQANLEVSLRARDLARESARLSTIAFVNGTGTSFDLVDTASKLREAEIDLAIKDFELVRARIAAFIARANCSL